MKPIQYALLWVGEALLFTVVLVLIYVLMPEVKVYSLIRMYTGVIPGDTWDKYYFLFLCVSSLLIVALLVYLTALIKKR
jgi:ABC-type Fe3+-siderophore transport system permease subunit